MSDYEAEVNTHSRSLFCVAEGFGRSPTGTRDRFRDFVLCLLQRMREVLWGYIGEIALVGGTGKMER